MKAKNSKRNKSTISDTTTNATPQTLAEGNFQIEDGIEMPATSRKALYPWASMNPGQSFFAPVSKKGGSARAYIASKRYGKHFLSRAETKDGVDGVRFFCVAEPMQVRVKK